MATDLEALKSAIKLVADAARDTIEAMAAGGGSVATAISFSDIIPDVFQLVPKIGEIPSEVKSLSPNDYMTLVNELVQDLNITDAHAGSIIDAATKLLQECIGNVAPLVQELVSAVKKK